LYLIWLFDKWVGGINYAWTTNWKMSNCLWFKVYLKTKYFFYWNVVCLQLILTAIIKFKPQTLNRQLNHSTFKINKIHKFLIAPLFFEWWSISTLKKKVFHTYEYNGINSNNLWEQTTMEEIWFIVLIIIT
jgi:hypothetical protein